MITKNHVCPAEKAWVLNNNFRKLVHPPRKILNGYIKEGMKVVDLGCGPGFFTLPMAQMAGKKGSVTGVDLQAAMLVKVKTRIAGTAVEPLIKLHLCSEDKIGLDDTYDFALAFYVVHESPNPAGFIKEVHSILKPGGKFFLIEPKGHVSKREFSSAVNTALKSGFIIESEPRVWFSRAMVFTRL